MNGYLNSDRIMFDRVIFIPFTITFGCVRSKASVCKCVPDEVVMPIQFEGDVFEFVFRGHTNNGIVRCE